MTTPAISKPLTWVAVMVPTRSSVAPVASKTSRSVPVDPLTASGPVMWTSRPPTAPGPSPIRTRSSPAPVVTLVAPGPVPWISTVSLPSPVVTVVGPPAIVLAMVRVSFPLPSARETTSIPV